MSRRRLPLLLVLSACIGLLVYEDVDRHVRAVALLMRWTAAPGPRRLSTHGEHEVATTDLTLHTDSRAIAAVEYRPVDVARPPPVLLVHGAHYRGIRESRLKAFAHALASAGLLVITPQIDELTHHNVAASTLRVLRRLTRAAAKRAGYETVGVIGISFAGSLALLAAAGDDESRAFGSVTAVGAYASLDRVGHWYAGDAAAGPDRTPLTLHPHPYGARVLFHAHADTVFGKDADQVRRVLDLYLHDRLRQARAFAETLDEPIRADVLVLVGPETSPLADKLRSLLRVHRRELAAISPERQLAGLRVPVLLVHGVDDPIIPSSETAWLALEVPQGVLRASLITGAIRHAELQEKPSLQELWALVRWTAAMLEVNEHQARSALLQ